MKEYFKDLEDWEYSLVCSECGNDEVGKTFTYMRTTSNNEVWWCEKCKREEATLKKPNEDNY